MEDMALYVPSLCVPDRIPSLDCRLIKQLWLPVGKQDPDSHFRRSGRRVDQGFRHCFGTVTSAILPSSLLGRWSLPSDIQSHLPPLLDRPA
jgi:hypothetical protein